MKLAKDKNPFAKEILNQVQGRQKAKKKIPLWANTEGIIFPVGLSIEQSSSEATAKHKASLISGKKLIDLSSGFGIDSFYFSKVFKEIVLVEPNEELLGIVKHNYNCLKVDNASFYNNKAEEFVEIYKQKSDFIYVDPSRRLSSNKKIINLKDCEPNVVNLLPAMFLIAPSLLIKTAPLLDINSALTELTGVKKVIVLSYQNECKEVLYLLEKNFNKEPIIEAVNIKENQQEIFNFTLTQEKEAKINLSPPLKYLYEPNAAIMKAGAFKLVAQQFNLFKLHSNSHLYTSETLVKDFPGRTFLIEAVCKYKKKEIEFVLKNKKANIAVRNFKEKVSDILKKTGITEGGDKYLFATTDYKESAIIVICNKIFFK
ncbi:MAG: class I SAM-dependent methyltransferase [Bacteroidota bacterium]|nr:class I SAM-dependent methyltransferase [Bacteroidota bacterium]